MKRAVIVIFFFFISFCFFAQELKTLHEELQETAVGEITAVKNITDKIFKIDPYDDYAVYYLAESYKFENRNDLLLALFKELYQLDTLNPKPYILSSKIQFNSISLSDTGCLAPLKKAYRLDPNNAESNRLLGYNYYELFHRSIVKKKTDRSYFYAKESKKYLIKFCTIDVNSIFLYKYPIIQLSNYLNDTIFITDIKNLKTPSQYRFEDINKSTPYFPFEFLMTLPSGWEKDYKSDVLHQSSMAQFRSNWYSPKLYGMQEPIIYNQPQKTIYRFIWLRSFHKPIAIRLEKTENTIELTWKMTSGAGGYETGYIVTNKTKTLTEPEWQQFKKLLEKANYFEMTPRMETSGNDGAQWIIEGIENNNYHFVDRWSQPRGTNFQKCAIYLLKLTDLQIPEKDIY